MSAALGEHLRRDFRRAADDERVVCADRLRQLPRGKPEPHVDLEDRISTQYLDPLRCEIVSHEDAEGHE